MPEYFFAIAFPGELNDRQLDRDVRMNDQGRLAKVMLVLVVSMTAGALVLLSLQGNPIKPMPFSLSSQSRLTSADTALGTEIGIEQDRWQGIEVSYCASESCLSSSLGLTGEMALRYHFVISDGTEGRDGQIYASNRWVKQLTCLNPSRGSYNGQAIRICLMVKDPQNPLSSSKQMRQLEALVMSLSKHCRIEARIDWKHSF